MVISDSRFVTGENSVFFCALRALCVKTFVVILFKERTLHERITCKGLDRLSRSCAPAFAPHACDRCLSWRKSVARRASSLCHLPHWRQDAHARANSRAYGRSF